MDSSINKSYNQKPMDSASFTKKLADNQAQEFVQSAAKKPQSAAATQKSQTTIGGENAISSVTSTTTSAIDSLTGVGTGVDATKPEIIPPGGVGASLFKDPEAVMLLVGDTQTKLSQKSIVGASQEIDTNLLKNKQQRAFRQEKLTERADEMREAQEAAKKAGVFGKLGIAGTVLTTVGSIALACVCPPLGAVAAVGGAALTVGAKVGQGVTEIDAAGHQQEADMLKADSEKMTKALKMGALYDEENRKYMKAMMDNIDSIFNTIMDGLKGAQDSKEHTIKHISSSTSV